MFVSFAFPLSLALIVRNHDPLDSYVFTYNISVLSNASPRFCVLVTSLS